MENFRIETSWSSQMERQIQVTFGKVSVEVSGSDVIKLNGDKVGTIPLQVGDLIVRRASSQFILIESNDLYVSFDGSNVYLTLGSVYRGRVRGLCGSFEYEERNDLKLRDGNLTCNTNVFSENYMIKDDKSFEKRKHQLEEKFVREEAVGYIANYVEINPISFHVYTIGKPLPSNS